MAGECQVASRGIQRREELVLNQHARGRERVEERGLSRIRVADDRDHRNRLTGTLAALLRAVAAHGFELAAQLADAATNALAVLLQLGFTGSTDADSAAHAAAARSARATADAGEITPLAGEPGQAILQLRQLHLQLALARARVLGEDIQNQRRAV